MARTGDGGHVGRAEEVREEGRAVGRQEREHGGSECRHGEKELWMHSVAPVGGSSMEFVVIER
jgi:hypothetical protein